jgi:hypothetical protein
MNERRATGGTTPSVSSSNNQFYVDELSKSQVVPKNGQNHTATFGGTMSSSGGARTPILAEKKLMRPSGQQFMKPTQASKAKLRYNNE